MTTVLIILEWKTQYHAYSPSITHIFIVSLISSRAPDSTYRNPEPGSTIGGSGDSKLHER